MWRTPGKGQEKCPCKTQSTEREPFETVITSPRLKHCRSTKRLNLLRGQPRSLKSGPQSQPHCKSTLGVRSFTPESSAWQCGARAWGNLRTRSNLCGANLAPKVQAPVPVRKRQCGRRFQMPSSLVPMPGPLRNIALDKRSSVKTYTEMRPTMSYQHPEVRTPLWRTFLA